MCGKDFMNKTEEKTKAIKRGRIQKNVKRGNKAEGKKWKKEIRNECRRKEREKNSIKPNEEKIK